MSVLELLVVIAICIMWAELRSMRHAIEKLGESSMADMVQPVEIDSAEIADGVTIALKRAGLLRPTNKVIA